MFRKSKRVSKKVEEPSPDLLKPSSPRSPDPTSKSGKKGKGSKKGEKGETTSKTNHVALGAKVWVPDRKEVWRLANVMYADDEKGYISIQFDDQKTKSASRFPLSDIRHYDDSQMKDYGDMSRMGDLNEASNLMLLKRRYQEDKIYTLNGDILLSINPYKDITGLYDKFEGYQRPLNGDIPQEPHLYAVADNAFQAMMQTDDVLRVKQGVLAQSVLINGESGSGKTEASKYIMRYLAHQSHQIRVERHRAFATEGEALPDGILSDEIGTAVEHSVIESNPLLESFGNAKTVRNDNSSRFGKYIRVHYDTYGCIDGASTQHYLLEKSRIVEQQPGERNYHIFYQLLAGMDDAMRESLGLPSSPNNFAILGGSNASTISQGIDDKSNFSVTQTAMSAVGITVQEQEEIWRIIAAVLALGNISFKEVSSEGSEVSEDTIPWMELAAKHLGIESTHLENALLFRTVKGGKRVSVSVIKLTPSQATDSRNGLAKAVYSELFDWLVSKINASTKYKLAGGDKNQKMFQELSIANGETPEEENISGDMFIGILDIFGFEVLQRNSFEQLCINFANEVLQREFDHHVFELEQRLYIQEGIDWSMLSFQDNSSLLELFQAKRTGLFSLLDEQGMLGARATDEGLIGRIYDTHAKKGSVHPAFEKPRFDKDCFIIKHYAGAITYHVDGFLSKNNDALHHDLSTLLVAKTEHNEFLHKLCVDSFKHVVDSNQHSITTLYTVSSRLRNQMAQLVKTLEKTIPHFVRCIKPNQDKAPQSFDGPLVVNQLNYLGLMEAVRIRREGFPVRRSFEELVTKYALLLTGTSVIWTPPANASDVTPEEHELARLACNTILEGELGPASRGHGWQVGKSDKVFLREGILAKLDEGVRRVMNRNATALQALMRRRRAQAEMRKKKQAVQSIASHFRRYKALQEYKTSRDQILKLQTQVRRFIAQRNYRKAVRDITTAQSLYRGAVGRREAVHKRRVYTAACLKIQRTFRATGPYKEYVFVREQTSRVQAVMRGALVRVRYKRVLRARQPYEYNPAVLRANEAVAIATLVVKSTPNKLFLGLAKSRKRRQLIMTTSVPPRILYVDPDTGKLKGEIPYVQGTTEAACPGEKEFIIHSKGTKEKPNRTEWNFVDMLGNSHDWVEFLREPVTMMDMMKIGSTIGDDQQLKFMKQRVLLKQGELVKLAIKSQKNWRKRYFILYDSHITWYKTSTKTKKTSGSLLISPKTIVSIPSKPADPSSPKGKKEDTSDASKTSNMPWKEHCFDIQSPGLPNPVRIQCASEKEQKEWVQAIEEATAFAGLEQQQ